MSKKKIKVIEPVEPTVEQPTNVNVMPGKPAWAEKSFWDRLDNEGKKKVLKG